MDCSGFVKLLKSWNFGLSVGVSVSGPRSTGGYTTTPCPDTEKQSNRTPTAFRSFRKHNATIKWNFTKKFSHVALSYEDINFSSFKSTYLLSFLKVGKFIEKFRKKIKFNHRNFTKLSRIKSKIIEYMRPHEMDDMYTFVSWPVEKNWLWDSRSVMCVLVEIFFWQISL